MQARIVWIVAVALIVIGLARLLEPGMSFLIFLAVLPYILVIFFVREQHIRYLRQCVERYLH
jgi:hypothetical protein